MNKFNYAISNPPYQVDNQRGKVRTTTDIYPFFHRNATFFADDVTMIYPASWQKNITKDLGEYLLKNGLKKSVFYKSQYVFGDAIRKNFPISVVITENNYSGKLFINDIIVDRNISTWLDAPAKQILFNAVRKLSKINGGVKAGINTSNVADSGMNFTKNSDLMINPIKVYIKENPGKQADGSWWFIDAKELLSMYPYLDLSTYKCTMASAPIGRLGIYNETTNAFGNLCMRVVEPNYTFSTTWVELAAFDTFEEANNYMNYMNSKIATILIGFDFSRKSFGSFIPDLIDYSNDNEIFTMDKDLSSSHKYYGLSLDERLCLFFGLSKSESEIVLNYKF